MRSLSVVLLLTISSVSFADDLNLEAFQADVDSLHISAAKQIEDIKQKLAADVEKLKDKHLATVEQQRKTAMVNDELEKAVQLRESKRQIEEYKVKDPEKTRVEPNSKKSVWQFATGEQIVRRADGRWEENRLFIWLEKERSKSSITLYDPTRDFWAKIYDDAFLDQNPSLRERNLWSLRKGSWVR